MTVKNEHPDEYKAHVIVLPSYAPVAICLTRKIAFDMAKAIYGDLWKSKLVVRVATSQDWKMIK